MTDEVWEDVTKAATREEAIEEDRQYDILLLGGWVKVCQDAYGTPDQAPGAPLRPRTRSPSRTPTADLNDRAASTTPRVARHF